MRSARAIFGCAALLSAAACGGGTPAATATARAAEQSTPSPGVAKDPGGADSASTTDDFAHAAGADATELERARARIRELELRVAELETARVEREREWLDYTQDIARLGSLAELERVRFNAASDPAAAPALGEPRAAPRPAPPADAAALQRDVEIARSLRALLLVEQVAGLELLETGHLSGGATGPVVFRTLDDRGVPLGALCAARLRLEASLSARTLVLVLEDGYERRGDARTPFPPEKSRAGTLAHALEVLAAPRDASAPPDADAADSGADPAPSAVASTTPSAVARSTPDAPPAAGTRRLVFTHVDPRPWIEALPELFRDADVHAAPDDGRWDLAGVRFTLNEFLRADAAAGHWRLVSLGGVTDGEFRDVQLDELDREGKLTRKLFADRLSIVPQTNGVVLELADGAQLRGDVKTPFLDGHHTIFLPRADLAAWRAAGLPGLSEPPRRARR